MLCVFGWCDIVMPPLPSDVWMSTNGFVWSEQSAAAEFDPVYLASMTGDSMGNLFIAGGVLEIGGNPRMSSGRVWMSTAASAGRQWRMMSDAVDANGVSSGPGARAVSILLSTPRNELLWLSGVNTGTYTNNPLSYRSDVWVSTNQGRSFNPITLNSAWGRRDDANAEITTGGLTVLAAGYGGTTATAQGEIFNGQLLRHATDHTRSTSSLSLIRCSITHVVACSLFGVSDCTVVRCLGECGWSAKHPTITTIPTPPPSYIPHPPLPTDRLYLCPRRLCAVLVQCGLGGYSWGLCVKDAEWDDRRYQMTLLDGDGVLWVMGGNNNGNRYNDVWKSVWSFNNLADTASRCHVSIPACGSGLQCLPSSGNTLVSTNSSAVYCDSCPFSTSTSSAASGTVMAVIVVLVIVSVLSLLALCYTCNKLRSAGIASPIPLASGAQQWWSKSSSEGAVGSSDSSSATNGHESGNGIYQPLRIRDQA